MENTKESILKRIYNAFSVKDYFTRKMFARQFGPALVASFGLGFADMADSVVLGQSMGVTGLAAVSLVLPIFMIVNIIMHGLGNGGCIVYSTLCAEGKTEEAKRSFQGVISLALILGVGLAILGNVFLEGLLVILGASADDPVLYYATEGYLRITLWGIPFFFMAYILYYYLRNDDQEKLANYAFTAGNILDICLNVILVLVFKMGVVGAALSTVLGVVFMIVLYSGAIITKKTNLNFSNYKPDFKGVFPCFRLGFSSSVSFLFSMIFLLIANNMLMRISGGIGVAVLDVVQIAASMSGYIFDAVNKSIQPIISTYSGENDYGEVKNVFKFSLAIGVLLGIIQTLFCVAFPEIICKFFGIASPESLPVAVVALRIFSVCIVFLGINQVTENYYQASMEEKSAYLVSLLRTFIILIPMLLICYFFGITGIWWMYPCTEIITCVIVYYVGKSGKLKNECFDNNRIFKKTITSSMIELSTVLDDIDVFMEKWEANVKQSYFVKLAVEELCNVIMQKAFVDENGFIRITLLAKGDFFELHFRDSAAMFNPFSFDTKSAIDANFDADTDMDVMGIHMIKKKAQDFNYRHFQGFNSYIVKI